MVRLTIIFHSVTVLLALYLFLCFAWWWRKSDDVNAIYKYTCFLMVGIAITHGGAVWLYVMKWIHQDLDLEQHVPRWWLLRQFFEIIPLALYARYVTDKIRNGHMQRIVVRHPNRRNQPERRKTHRREEDRIKKGML